DSCGSVGDKDHPNTDVASPVDAKVDEFQSCVKFAGAIAEGAGCWALHKGITHAVITQDAAVLAPQLRRQMLIVGNKTFVDCQIAFFIRPKNKLRTAFPQGPEIEIEIEDPYFQDQPFIKLPDLALIDNRVSIVSGKGSDFTRADAFVKKLRKTESHAVCCVCWTPAQPGQCWRRNRVGRINIGPGLAERSDPQKVFHREFPQLFAHPLCGVLPQAGRTSCLVIEHFLDVAHDRHDSSFDRGLAKKSEAPCRAIERPCKRKLLDLGRLEPPGG